MHPTRVERIFSPGPYSVPRITTGGAVTLVLTAVALLSACFFYGASFNLIFVLPAIAVPLLMIGSCDSRQLLGAIQANRLAVGVCIATLFLFAFHHLWFSISPHTSFAASMVAAALPLWTIAAIVLRSKAQLLQAVFLLVLVLATCSAIDFIVSGQRAHAPLWDPNNYVSLLYLAWIPWAFNRLDQPNTSLVGVVWTFVVSVTFGLALLAAHSRVAMLVVAGVGVGGLISCWWFRLRWVYGVAVLVAVIISFGLYFGLNDSGSVSAVGADASQEADGIRLLMINSGLQAVENLGGVHGTGLGTFSLIYPIFRSLDEQSTTGIVLHNDYLQVFLEGGIWLFAPLLTLCLSLLIYGTRLARSRQWRPRVGLYLAILCLMVHAAVNYVFYVLPLMLVMGLYLGILFAREAIPLGDVGPAALRRIFAAKWLFIGLMLINCFYLSLDALTQGVFANQQHVPGSAYIKSDLSRMLTFARSAQSLNSRRAMPVLGEALLLDNKMIAGGPATLLTPTQLAYQHSLSINPWDAYARVSYARFLLRHAEAIGPNSRQMAEKELRAALQINPSDVDASAELISMYHRDGRLDGALLLSRQVLSWCEVIKRRGVPDSHRVFREIDALALRSGAAELDMALQSCTSRSYRASASGREATWMMRWLRGFSHPSS